jgi:hypothetical protein
LTFVTSYKAGLEAIEISAFGDQKAVLLGSIINNEKRIDSNFIMKEVNSISVKIDRLFSQGSMWQYLDRIQFNDTNVKDIVIGIDSPGEF